MKNEEEFAQSFYENLFEIAPAVKQLFKENMLEQGRMLTHMLRGIVYGLSRPEYLKLGMRSLGKQHENYGVKPEHYPIVREILLKTIIQTLGDKCTPSIEKSWTAAINMVIAAMQEE